MEPRGKDETARAGFSNPFNEDETVSQPRSTTDSGVSPQRTRSLAEDTALQEDVAPADTATFASPDAESNVTGGSASSNDTTQSPPGEPAIAIKEPTSDDDIEKVSTQSSPASQSPDSHGHHRHEDALEKIKTTASRMADKFHLGSVQVTGPSRLFNPTNVRARIKWASDHDQQAARSGRKDTDFDLLWRSRDNRKGRGSIAVRNSAFQDPDSQQSSARKRKVILHLKNTGDVLKRMLTTFPYWDMAFWSGWSYTIGSALFVMDGAFAWTPAAFPENEFEGEEKYGVPLCFFIGALFFQIGATMAYFEAVNDGSFHGSAMRRLMEGHEEEQKAMLDEKIRDFFGGFRTHRHVDEDEEAAERLAEKVDPEAGWKAKERKERPGSIYPPAKHPGRRRGAMDMGEAEEGQSGTYLTWRWWPR